MLILSEFVLTNKENINYVLFLGDDSIIALHNDQEIPNMEKYIKENYNMQSKLYKHKGVATFC